MLENCEYAYQCLLCADHYCSNWYQNRTVVKSTVRRGRSVFVATPPCRHIKLAVADAQARAHSSCSALQTSACLCPCACVRPQLTSTQTHKERHGKTDRHRQVRRCVWRSRMSMAGAHYAPQLGSQAGGRVERQLKCSG